jgi:hypothetical protein
MRKRFINRLVFAVVIMLVLVGGEFSARLHLILSAPGPEQPAYLQTEWQSIPVYMSPDGWAFRDFHGRYYNIDNGLRRVTRQPLVYTSTVYLYGNSGMFDPDVPDEATTASQLQALFNAQGYPVRVVNRAMTGVTVSGELIRLKETPIQRGDTVLFVDGAMDITNPSCDSNLAVLTVVCQSVPRPTGYDKVGDYLRTIERAHVYATSRGVYFYKLVQPCAGWHGMTPFGAAIDVPADDFVNGCHMSPAGDAIAARALFDALTLV